MNAQTVVSDLLKHSPGLRPVRLKALFPLASYIGCADAKITSCSSDSRTVEPQGAFVVIPGTEKNGVEFVPEAIAKGASLLITEKPLNSRGLPQIIVPSAREAYAIICSALAGHPSRSMNLAAVTGTNGKTSVSWILRSIVQSSHGSCGMMGTIEYDDTFNIFPSSLTTPPAESIQTMLGKTRKNGCRHAVLEASSHAIDQHRLAGCELDAAVITNVTHDHLDYHETRESYLKTKASISHYLRESGLMLINADDPGSLEAAISVSHPLILTYGLNMPADLKGVIQEESLRGSRFSVTIDHEEQSYSTPLIGRHQVSNCLAAIAIAMRWEISPEDIQRGLSRLRSIPGRLQHVEQQQGVSYFVDYAHTPDALEQSLSHIRRLTSGRIILVFGAGGDRDPAKRPLMGKASQQADISIITSDNPRSENPDTIIDDIKAGLDAGTEHVFCEPDRRKAIDQAVRLASSGDVVLIAGKGHEKEQLIGNDRIPFDDCLVIRDCLDRPAPRSHLAMTAKSHI
ncbi:UDP-N-acetylmuramoyl-L-alanyl-D-glutamate--2,6-diaminopimelate ligase [Planctomycetaceae bacterium]|jgi:UDP-N-acetylmuramoyl-L-alanyl-D-glutamate--2,6-diaminopimelate ligase|nr:UDP-N-acetylmuramoyl-L-alanyl-D-glutamate--2,6-diaminopimelate ligase [Planctomycetaceae bacterium]